MTEAQASLSKPKSIFQNTNFLILWLGKLVSTLGDSFFSFATTVWMISTVGLESLAILMAITAVPRIVLGPIAGTVVDRVNRKTVIWLSDFIRGFLMILGSIVIAYGASIYFFYLTFILCNVVSAFFDPAVSAVLPNVVDKSQLSQANSIRQGTSSFAGIIGPVLASIMLLSLGGVEQAVPLLILVNGITFILSGFSELFLNIPQVHLEKIKNDSKSVFKSFLMQLAEGFVYVKKSQMILKMMVVFAIMNFFLAPVFQLIMPAVIIDQIGHESWLGYIQATVAMGFILGAICLSIKKTNTHYSLLLGGLLGLGVTILGLGIAIALVSFNLLNDLSVLLLLLVMTLCIGASAAIANIKVSTIMQIIVPDEVRGRVFALLNTLGAGLVPLSLALTGLVTIKFPLYVQPIFGGIAVVVAALMFARIKELKKY